MLKTTVAIVFLTIAACCPAAMVAQPAVKYYANDPFIERAVSISKAFPYTEAQPGHYMLKLKPGQNDSGLHKKGFVVVRNLGRGRVIVKAEPEMLKRHSILYEVAIPVNHLWKFHATFPLPDIDRSAHFMVKTTDIATVERTASNAGLKIVRSHGEHNAVVISGKYKTILNCIVPLEEVLYVNLESQVPKEESRVLDLYLGPNSINRLHDVYPSLEGAGMTISMQELRYDDEDIDLRGRHIPSTLEASTISNHATDMATIAAGAGNSFITGRGVARAANITTSDYSDLLPDRDEDYAALQAWIQNHSYGTEIENFYGLLAEAFDASANRNPELLHVFSSGNKGTDAPSSGIYQSITGFANLTGNSKMAKNVLTVGAVDTTGNPLVFSSRGPAFDGRIKPELAAYSTQGTSNATALVSGVALLLQQHYKSSTGNFPPSALIRSVLINSAEEAGQPGPDYSTGFGNMNAFRALTTLEEHRYWAGTISEDAQQTFDLEVPEGVMNLKVTLVWNDPAAMAGSAKALVNDLDMKLAFGATAWLPWVLDGTPDPARLSTAAGRGEDHLNNVEQITLENPAPGTYTLVIHGTDVPIGPQSFYISYQWDNAGTFEWEFPTGSDNMPYNGETATYFYWNSTLNATAGQLEYKLENGEWQLIAPNLDLRKGYFRWAGAPHEYAGAQARMIVGTEVFETEPFTISGALPVSVGFNCADSVRIQWPSIPGVTGYRIHTLGTSFLEPVTETTDTAFVFRKHEFGSVFAVTPRLSAQYAIRSAAFDYETLGTRCFIFSFTDELVPEEGIYLQLQLGTTYNVDRVIFEHRASDDFQEIGSLVPSKNNVLRFLHDQPMQGYNQYRVRVQLRNAQEVTSDTLENYFITGAPFHVFPNPVAKSGQLRIFAKAVPDQKARFILYKTDGTKMLSTELFSDREFITLGDLPPGLYLYRLQSGAGITRGKLVISP